MSSPRAVGASAVRLDADPVGAQDHPRTVRRVTKATGLISTAALDHMHQDLAWYRTLPAERRSWIGLIVKAGIDNFAAWLNDPERGARLPIEVFSAAPPEMTRAVSL